MNNLYKNIIKPILTNEIVVNWIAPIITGILVVVIPAFVLKFLRFRKDIKKINNVNDRFINSIRPYIIKKIKISAELITDIRKAIIMDSDIKEKYVFSEIDLRNKLIMDINESKYIDEINKKELIDFTYEIFENFKNEGYFPTTKENVDIKAKRCNIRNSYLKNPIILLLISQIMIIVTLYFDKSGVNPEDNYAILLPLILGIFSVFSFLIDFLFKSLKSDVSENRKLYSDYENLVYKTVLNKILKDNKKKNNNDNIK